MRISDWSSDVCSSDLLTHIPFDNVFPTPGVPAHDTSGLDFAALGEILAAIAIGAVIGIVLARRIAMPALPQLVPAFHSLCGLAAVAVAAGALLHPCAFGIPQTAKAPCRGRRGT